MRIITSPVGLARLGTAAVSALGLALIAGYTQGQESQLSENSKVSVRALEEVVVTARRREESLQDTPVAVSAVSAEELRANNANTIGDLAFIVPGLDKREGRKQGGFAIRGVGQPRIDAVDVDPGVGVYVDGIFLSRDDSQLVDAVSVESVQVLRGPQGTLFGKNTVGGAILVTTKKPADEFTATFSTKLDSFARRDGQLSLDLPLVSEKLLTRFTVAQKKSDGYAEDVDSGESFGDDNRTLLVAQVQALLADNLTLGLLGYYSDQDERSAPSNCEVVNPDTVLMASRAPGKSANYRTSCGNAESLRERHKVQHENVGLRYASEDLLVGLTLNWQFENSELKSVSSYAESGPKIRDFNFDATDLLTVGNNTVSLNALEAQGLIDKDDGYRETWAQELQFSGEKLDSRLSYTTGLFVSHEKLANESSGPYLTESGWIGFEELPGAPPLPPGFLFVTAIVGGQSPTFENRSYAVFGQAIYDVLPTLQLTLGARYSFEKRSLKTDLFKEGATAPPPFPPDAPIGVLSEMQFNSLQDQPVPVEFLRTDEVEEDFSRFSPMASLAWNLAERFELGGVDNLMAYLTVSEGFKAGGFSGNLTGFKTFDPEVVLNKELGIKMDALDRRLRLNMAAYHGDYTDIQLLITKANEAGAIEATTTNAGEAVIQGLELETVFLLTSNLTLTASGNYIDADFVKYDDVLAISSGGTAFTNVQVDRSDEPFPHIPKVSYNLSARYYLPTDSIGDFDFVLSRSYRDKQYMGQDAQSYEPQFRDKSFTGDITLYNLRASWIPFADQSLKLSLFGNNVTDEDYIASGVTLAGSFGASSLTPGRRAHWGLEISYELR